jgi:hypothetical protein
MIKSVLNGLFNTSITSTDSLNIIEFISRKVNECIEPFTSNQFVSCYGSLKNFNSNENCIEDLLNSLNNKLKKNILFVNVHDCRIAMLGLRHMSSDNREVIRALNMFYDIYSRDQPDSTDIQHAYIGIQNMDVTHLDVLRFFKFLNKNALQFKFDNQEASDIMYSIFLLTKPLPMCDAMTEKVINHIISNIELDNIQSSHLERFIQILQFILHYNNISLKLQNKMNEILKCLYTLQQSYENMSKLTFTSTNIQTDVYNLLMKSTSSNNTSSNNIEILQNIRLFGFECDLVLKIINKQNQIEYINLEIDGATHQWLRKQQFCSLRDQYLREKHNVDILRYNIMNIDEFSIANDIVNTFLAHVAVKLES